MRAWRLGRRSSKRSPSLSTARPPHNRIRRRDAVPEGETTTVGPIVLRCNSDVNRRVQHSGGLHQRFSNAG